MKDTQNLMLLDRDYPVVTSKMNIAQDPLTKPFTLTAKCCIVANDITDISPWVIKPLPIQVWI